jgi:hypothetical protein
MSVSYRERRLSKVLNLLKGEREKKFFLSLYHSLPAVSKKYMKDALAFQVYERYQNEELDSLGYGILSEFSPQEDVIENFYLECKDKTPFIKAFHSPVSRLIWRERLKRSKEFYLYGYDINTRENVS